MCINNVGRKLRAKIRFLFSGQNLSFFGSLKKSPFDPNNFFINKFLSSAVL